MLFLKALAMFLLAMFIVVMGLVLVGLITVFEVIGKIIVTLLIGGACVYFAVAACAKEVSQHFSSSPSKKDR